MKLGGLFSGVGGFELAWTQLGHEVAWMCEWDPKARKVLEARFPGVPIYPDVRDLDPAEVEAVDVLTGGSPCQGFSVAGTRSGLEHSESQLFADYVRIMDGLADRGLQYAVWENVPGVLSITNDDGERTFEHVVTALAGGTVPVRLPTDRRWNTGLAAGRGRAVAWRVLDSRYFGVAQRRRRVFACVAFGDSCEDRAGRTLLAVAEGVRGDSPSSVQAGQGTSASADAGAGSTRIPELAGAIGAQQRGGQDLDGTTYLPDVPAFGMIGNSGQEGAAGGVASGVGNPSVARTLKARADGSWTADGHGNEVVVDRAGVPSVAGRIAAEYAVTLKARMGKDTNTEEAAGGHLIIEPSYGMYGNSGQEGATVEEQPAITASHGQPGNVGVPAILLQMRDGKAGGGKGPLLSEELSATLKGAFAQTLFQPQAFDEMNFTTDEDTHHVLRAGTKQSTGVMVPQAFRKAARAQSSEDAESWVEDGQANTLNVFDVGDTRTTHAIVEPTEQMVDFGRTSDRIRINAETAATLQAGGGGAASGLYMQQYGVRRLTPVECERLQSFPDGWTEPAGSDSARYKAMGNAVTVNVVRWILSRMESQ
jgi:site-specific DNA-cytosine methylase